MSIAAWIIAYVLIGLLLLITLVYVGVLLLKAYAIRKDYRKPPNYGFILGTPSDFDEPTSAPDTPPSPKRLEASVKPPTEPPYSGEYKRDACYLGHGQVSVLEKFPYLLKNNPYDTIANKVRDT